MDISALNDPQQTALNKIERIEVVRSFIENIPHLQFLKNAKGALNASDLESIQREVELSVLFIQMGNFIRLGGELEIFFGHYYAFKKNISWRSISENLPKGFNGGIFQRVIPSPSTKKGKTLIDLYKGINIDLTANKHFKSIQEYFAHRHLYAHQTGLIDAQYLKQIEQIFDNSERMRIENNVLKLASANKIEDAVVYWLEPLQVRFSLLIENTKNFIKALPP